MTEKQGLFDKLYKVGKDALDQMRKPRVRKAVQRKLQKAFDDAQDRIDNANVAIDKAREDFDHYDVNVILGERQMIASCEELKAGIRQEYKDLFEEELPE